MRRKIVAGNWKMNGSRASLFDYCDALAPSLEKLPEDVQVVLAPPAVYFADLQSLLKSSSIQLSGQNVAATKAGAFTGELSADMLSDFDCRWCLVGHSERRSLFGETDEEVLAKVERLLEVGLVPILCVGETLAQRDEGMAVDVVRKQLSAVFDRIDVTRLDSLVVAYEPVWAIGTGKTATPEQAQEMHASIRAVASEKARGFGQELTILYGGSVNAGNARALFAQQDIDGGLVGGASLKAEEFSQICESMG